MGVRCTLLGHRYGEAEIEREREERGEEAVVTIREVKTCSRCGNRSIVSENKEVTTVRGADDVAVPDDADAAPTSEPRPTEPESGDPVAGGTVDEADLDAGPEGGEASAGEDAAQGPEHDSETDDGVILEDDEEESAEREYGEWPDTEGDHGSAEADPAAASAAEQAPWPDSDEADDEGYDAAPPGGEPADVEYPGSADAEPQEADDPNERDGESGSPDAGEILDDVSEPANQPADEGADFERAREAGSPSRPSTDGTELYCPACGYRDPSRDGSLREGDICPECRKGYLAAGE